MQSFGEPKRQESIRSSAATKAALPEIPGICPACLSCVMLCHVVVYSTTAPAAGASASQGSNGGGGGTNLRTERRHVCVCVSLGGIIGNKFRHASWTIVFAMLDLALPLHYHCILAGGSAGSRWLLILHVERDTCFTLHEIRVSFT